MQLQARDTRMATRSPPLQATLAEARKDPPRSLQREHDLGLDSGLQHSENGCLLSQPLWMVFHSLPQPQETKAPPETSAPIACAFSHLLRHRDVGGGQCLPPRGLASLHAQGFLLRPEAREFSPARLLHLRLITGAGPCPTPRLPWACAAPQSRAGAAPLASGPLPRLCPLPGPTPPLGLATSVSPRPWHSLSHSAVIVPLQTHSHTPRGGHRPPTSTHSSLRAHQARAGCRMNTSPE